MHYHGAQYVLDGEAVPNTEAPAPMLLSSGFTDDLFPVGRDAALRDARQEAVPAGPLKLMYLDYGHMRGQNKAADTARLKHADQRLDRPLRHGRGRGAPSRT